VNLSLGENFGKKYGSGMGFKLLENLKLVWRNLDYLEAPEANMFPLQLE